MTIAVTTAAFMALLMAVIAIAITILAIAVATATARARAYILLHSLCHFFIRRHGSVVNGHAKVLIHCGQQLIQLHASLKITTANLVIYHALAQVIKLFDFLLGRSHAGHLLIAQLFTVILCLTVQCRSICILKEQANASMGGNNLLALRESVSQI